MRNSNCLALAPTATISNIAGALPSTEPIYKNMYVKSNQFGDFTVVNHYLVEDLKKAGLWSPRMAELIKYHDGRVTAIGEIPERLRAKYKETFEIEPYWVIKAAAYRGKWIDQSQSVNVFYSGSSGKDLNDIYFQAWEMGLKTTYYLRTLAASQVEKSTVSTAEYGSTHKRGTAAATPDNEQLGAKKPETQATKPSFTAVSETVNSPRNETSAQSAKDSVTAAEASAPTGLKGLCRIDDPNCEACQ
jgi:ribonucleoside-diphosphate reductase alpha chain